MPSLKEIQERLQKLIIQRDDSSAIAQQQGILEAKTVSRLSAYRNGYVARLIEAFEETYETVERLMGHEAFGSAVESFVRQHPSHSYNISDVGKSFPDFLTDPCLKDVARLDFLLSESFHAPNVDSLIKEEVAQISPERLPELRFLFQPSVRIFHSVWNVFEIWDASAAPKRSETFLMLYRKDDVVMVLPVEKAQFFLLKKLMEEKPLGDVLAMVESESDEIFSKLTAWFAGWMEMKLITKLY